MTVNDWTRPLVCVSVWVQFFCGKFKSSLGVCVCVLFGVVGVRFFGGQNPWRDCGRTECTLLLLHHHHPVVTLSSSVISRDIKAVGSPNDEKSTESLLDSGLMSVVWLQWRKQNRHHVTDGTWSSAGVCHTPTGTLQQQHVHISFKTKSHSRWLTYRIQIVVIIIKQVKKDIIQVKDKQF